jgi:hypothetical protein
MNSIADQEFTEKRRYEMVLNSWPNVNLDDAAIIPRHNF